MTDYEGLNLESDPYYEGEAANASNEAEYMNQLEQEPTPPPMNSTPLTPDWLDGKFIDRNGTEYQIKMLSDRTVFENIKNPIASYFVYHPKLAALDAGRDSQIWNHGFSCGLSNYPDSEERKQRFLAGIKDEGREEELQTGQTQSQQPNDHIGEANEMVSATPPKEEAQGEAIYLSFYCSRCNKETLHYATENGEACKECGSVKMGLYRMKEEEKPDELLHLHAVDERGKSESQIVNITKMKEQRPSGNSGEVEGELKSKITEILRDHTTYVPQAKGYLIHGAIEKLNELFQFRISTLEAEREKVAGEAWITGRLRGADYPKESELSAEMALSTYLSSINQHHKQ